MYALVNKNTNKVERFVENFNIRNDTLYAKGVYDLTQFETIETFDMFDNDKKYKYISGEFMIDEEFESFKIEFEKNKHNEKILNEIKELDSNLIRFIEDIVGFLEPMGLSVPAEINNIIGIRKAKRSDLK